MRLACLEYDGRAGLKATAIGLESWLDWLEKKPIDAIEMDIVAGPEHSTSLPDFPEPSTGSLALSKRALELLGACAFEFSVALTIKGGNDTGEYVLGWAWQTDSYLEIVGDEYVVPLRLKAGVKPPHGLFMQPSVPFSGLQGYFFVTLETWRKIEAAGLTGLMKVGEYEVAE